MELLQFYYSRMVALAGGWIAATIAKSADVAPLTGTTVWCGGWSGICRSCFPSSPFPTVAQTAHHRRDQRCFVEVRRRTRPMVCFVNVESVDRIVCSIFQRFNLEWKTRTLNLFTQAA